MIVDMTTGCCNCCSGETLFGGCCTPGQFSFETTGNALLPTPTSVPFGSEGGGRHTGIPITIENSQCTQVGPGPGFGSGLPPLTYRPVRFTFRYTDPTTGLDVCYSFFFAFQYECVDATHIRVRFLTPTTSTPSPFQPTAPEGCAFAGAGDSEWQAAYASGDSDRLASVWDQIPHNTSSWQTVEWHPDPNPLVGACGGTGYYDPLPPVSMTLPADASIGLPSQSFDLEFQFGTPTGFPSGEYVDGTCPSYVNFATDPWVCCTAFDGSDVVGPNPGPPVVPDDRVLTPCCGVEGETVSKTLTVVANTLGVCPSLEFTIGVSYQTAYRAWIGTAIAGGSFITVVVWCNAPASDEWFARIYCDGILIWGAAGAQFTGDSCPVDMEAGPNTSDTSPCCGSGVPLLVRIYDPTIRNLGPPASLVGLLCQTR